MSFNLFDLDKAMMSAGWLKELQSEHTPETEEYGISSFVYHARKPFDPLKLYSFFQGGGKLPVLFEPRDSIGLLQILSICMSTLRLV